MPLGLNLRLSISGNTVTGEVIPDTTAPVIVTSTYSDPDLTLDITEASGAGTLVWATSDTTESPTFTVGGGWVGTTYETGSYAVTSGSNTDTITLTSTTPSGSRKLTFYVYDAADNLSLVDSETITVAAWVPDAFVDADWSVATGATLGGQLDVTIATLPANNGFAITDVEYELDASGSWVSSGGTVGFTITGLTASTSYDVRLRAVNSEGAGAAGNTETATSSAAAPSGFSDDFNRADESLETSSNWERGFDQGSVTADIVSNQLKLESIGANQRATVRYTGTVANDQSAAVTYVSEVGAFWGPTVRDTSTASSRDFYCIVIDGNGTGWFLAKFVGNVQTNMATGTLAGLLVISDKVKIEAIGTTIAAYVDTGSGWTLLGSVTDSAHSSGKPGVYSSIGGGGTQNIVVDDFVYTDETP